VINAIIFEYVYLAVSLGRCSLIKYQRSAYSSYYYKILCSIKNTLFNCKIDLL